MKEVNLVRNPVWSGGQDGVVEKSQYVTLIISIVGIFTLLP